MPDAVTSKLNCAPHWQQRLGTGGKWVGGKMMRRPLGRIRHMSDASWWSASACIYIKCSVCLCINELQSGNTVRSSIQNKSGTQSSILVQSWDSVSLLGGDLTQQPPSSSDWTSLSTLLPLWCLKQWGSYTRKVRNADSVGGFWHSSSGNVLLVCGLLCKRVEKSEGINANIFTLAWVTRSARVRVQLVVQASFAGRTGCK